MDGRAGMGGCGLEGPDRTGVGPRVEAEVSNLLLLHLHHPH